MVSMRWCLWLLPSLATATAPDCTTSGCKVLVLPWGNYDGCVDVNNVCKYSNVRFASPPIGSLRFAAPDYPPKTKLPLAVGNPGCIAITDTACLSQHPPPITNNSNSCNPKPFSNFTEDCLFLDIYVPQAAANMTDLPVVVWIYGGGFVAGSKTQFDPSTFPLYDGDGLVNTNLNGDLVIFVAGNYRLGAFGWLAGSYMEQNAQTNIGLLDQRKVLEFVHDNIAQLGGSNQKVSAWGESAGGSSLLHHLVANFSMTSTPAPPLFHRMIVQSPAYSYSWNRTGSLNETFKKFAGLVANRIGCKNADISCLRSAHTADLIWANQNITQELACNGTLPVGPAVDGQLITDIPTNLFGQGKCEQFQSIPFIKPCANSFLVQPLDSLIVSHVNLEIKYPLGTKSFSFIPLPIREHPLKPEYFEAFLNTFMFGDAYKDIRANISHQYRFDLIKRPDQVARAQHMIMDSSFVCNTRIALDAYMAKSTPVYAMDYDFLGTLKMATHASDLLPTFVTPSTNYTEFFECASKDYLPGWSARDVSNYLINEVGHGMQSYFISHAINGNPNTGARGPAAEFKWSAATIDHSHPTLGGRVAHVMKPSLNPLESAFRQNNIIDDQTADAVCGYWKVVAQNLTNAYNHAKALEDVEADNKPATVGHSVGFDAEL